MQSSRSSTISGKRPSRKSGSSNSIERGPKRTRRSARMSTRECSSRSSPPIGDLRLDAIPPYADFPPFKIDYYYSDDDEVAEEEVFFFEEGIFDCGPDTSESEEDTLPVRILTEYAIYNPETRRLLPLPPHEGTYSASGYIRPYYEGETMELDDMSSDDSDTAANGQLARLNKILEIWLDTEDYDDPRIWVRTKSAWYTLECPAENYQPYLLPVYIPHLLTCILVAKHGNKDSTYQEVLGYLDYTSNDSAFAVSYAAEILGRTLTLDDFKSVELEVRHNMEHCRIKTSRGPVNGRTKGVNTLQKHYHVPFATPTVGKIAQGLFYRTLLIAETNLDVDASLQNICVAEDILVVHRENPAKIMWGSQILGAPGFYSSVYLDGIQYYIGDTVAVEPGQDANMIRSANAAQKSSLTMNKLGNSAWFCIIQYFYEERTFDSVNMLFHGRWFQHGSQTVLAETANPQGLFLLDSCDSNLVSSIIQKIKVRQLGANDREPIVLAEQDIGSSSFHFSHKWDEYQFTFADPALDDEAALIRQYYLEKHKACYPCVLKYQRDLLANCIKTPVSLDINGQSYHVNDFVYVKKDRPLLAIGQITNLMFTSGSQELEVNFYKRYQSSGLGHQPADLHMLLPTTKTEVILASFLDGHCFVQNERNIADLDAWILDNDCWFVPKTSEQLKQCNTCMLSHQTSIKTEDAFKAQKKLRAMDLFAGAGGLTTGMDLSGFVKTCWAVELLPGPAKTLKVNNPKIEVYNQDCNALLKHAVELRDGKNPSPLKSLGDGKLLPPLPSPGDVDMIIGGPPCQSFSGLNRYKKADDIRHTLIPTMLSYVEFYRPKFVLIENVTGLLYCRLQGKQQGHKIVGGIESGMVKFIMRTLTSLGYQVQIKVLNAADYGSPQQRNRVIFWAAKLGLSLPKWPKPTHIPRGGHTHTVRKVSSIGHIPLASRNLLSYEEVHEHAPFYSVSIREAIDDLPSFDWINPGLLLPRRKQASGREAFPADVAELSGETAVSGFDWPVLYGHEPQHPYQLWSRRGLSKFARVTDQYTACFHSSVVERTVNIPLEPGADYSCLPPALWQVRKSSRTITEAKGSYYRPDADGQFRTMMTGVHPCTRCAVLHPEQNRVFTVREYARAQGFPDTYEFLSFEKGKNLLIQDQYRQIGNAVPVHLALALGKALGEDLVQDDETNEETSGGDSDISVEL